MQRLFVPELIKKGFWLGYLEWTSASLVWARATLQNLVRADSLDAMASRLCSWHGMACKARQSIRNFLYFFCSVTWQMLLNPLRTKTTLYLLLQGNKSLLYHQIGNRNFFIFITIQWNLMFCVDKIKYEHLAILSNLKSCQFAPKIVIFNLFICCQFEDSQIISPKIIPMSRRNI